MVVTMVTLIDTESVLYTVHTGDPLLGDFGDCREVWRKEVPFGSGERFRAGGPAFVAAAREQQQIAESYAMMPYEPNGDEEAFQEYAQQVEDDQKRFRPCSHSHCTEPAVEGSNRCAGHPYSVVR